MNKSLQRFQFENKLTILTFEFPFSGHSNDVNHLVLVENLLHRDGLFQVTSCPVHFVRNGTTVQLNLKDLRLLLEFVQLSITTRNPNQ